MHNMDTSDWKQNALLPKLLTEEDASYNAIGNDRNEANEILNKIRLRFQSIKATIRNKRLL